MHIMLVNDDGIFAPGIEAMARALVDDGHRVSVCAPDRERSANSHAATLDRPLHAKQWDFPGAAHAWAVDGTPADCARLGLFLLRDDPVDLVVSGINKGSNLGGACIYSGTVAAAMEASMAGTKALAVSLCFKWDDPTCAYNSDYTASARLGARTARWMMEQPPLPRGAIYNLNVPLGPYGDIRGIRAATLCPTFLDDPTYRVEQDELGLCYRRLRGEFPPLDDPNYDGPCTDQGYATLTKLTWDIRLNADDGEIGSLTL